MKKTDHAIVVVMGDIGRSPRMCYHAISLANHGWTVDFVGYNDSKPPEKILSDKQIRIIPVQKAPKIIKFNILNLIFKFFWLFLTFTYALFFKTKSSTSIILLQNPPALPSMLICYLAAKLKKASFIIDWHNYTYTLLFCENKSSINEEQKKKKSFCYKQQILELVMKWEKFFGKKANWNLCVSRAMQKDLKERFELNAFILYDKAPSWMFRPITINERHNFFIKLFEKYGIKEIEVKKDNNGNEMTIFSHKNQITGKAEMLKNRPLLLVSATSWTEDEDFDILLQALKGYIRKAKRINETDADNKLNSLIVIITGKGPLKDEFMKKFNLIDSKFVKVLSIWLDAEDYSKILASADLGICLHTSSSGLDLPMKISDMYGCHLPVFAVKFKALEELVQNDKVIHVFETSKDLEKALEDVASKSPYKNKLCEMTKEFSMQLATNWEDQWNAVLWPILSLELSNESDCNMIEKNY